MPWAVTFTGRTCTSGMVGLVGSSAGKPEQENGSPWNPSPLPIAGDVSRKGRRCQPNTGTSNVPIGAENREWEAGYPVPRPAQPREPVVETRSRPQRGVSAPFAGSGRSGARWGTRTSPAVLMLGPPDRGGHGPVEHMRGNWPRSRNSRWPLERCRWLGYSRSSWQPEQRRERDSPRCGYNAAVRTAEDLGWIGPVVQQLHKRIAQVASKVGFEPYLPPEGSCVLVERAELQPGALPMACVAVLCWVLWLRVGEVSGLRMGDVSLPLWLRF